ncbi:MAG: hypothetical protein KatS3mg057_0932 [Herpetosiphonaceae bacterium]|nr:MAG: hypothetical protein KatS3mg057_0932 [Herpetosiphonaceae bacterium]
MWARCSTEDDISVMEQHCTIMNIIVAHIAGLNEPNALLNAASSINGVEEPTEGSV